MLREERLAERALPIGERLGGGLRELLADGLVTDVRGDHAIWAVDLPEGVDAAAVRDEMLERGVIIRPIGASTIAYCPPLVIDDTDLDRCVEALRDATRAVRDRSTVSPPS